MRRLMSTMAALLLALALVPAVAFADGGKLAAGAALGSDAGWENAGSELAAQGALGAQASKAPSITFTRALSTPLVLKAGSSYALGTKASAGAKVSYLSSATETVSVSKAGKLKARAAGTAVVAAIAKSSGGTTKKTVRVRVVPASEYKAVKSISAKVGTKTLAIGQSTKVSTTFSPKAVSNRNLVYKSLTPKVATVNAEGVVTAKATGAAKVRVTSAANPKATYTVALKVTSRSVNKIKDYSWAKLKFISKKIAAAKSDKAGIAIAKKYGLVDADGKLTGAKKSFKMTVIDEYGEKSTVNASVRIVGFRQDKLASGGLAGISFEFANVPTEHEMNSERTNEGGWALSDMRSWLNSDFYKQLPSDLRSCIAAAKKRTNNVGQADSDDKSVVSTTKDKLWLLSSSEVYGNGSGAYAEGAQYKLYSDKKVTTSRYSFCKKLGADSWWWLRSPSPGYSDYFYFVYSNRGWLSHSGAGDALGVSPGFCF